MANEINNFGYCGKNCTECNFFYEKKCDGCKYISSQIETAPILETCQNCKIKFCAEKKGISFCFLCSNFPCPYFSFLSQDELTKIFEQKALIYESEVNSSYKNII